MGMSDYQFCTYFDAKYLVKGQALFRSLERWSGNFVLWVLCLDDMTYDVLLALSNPKIRLVKMSELEAFEPRLLQAQSDRTLVEYYWTCTPTWVAYVLEKQPAGTLVSYLDADLFFFSSPEPVFKEAGSASIIIHEHRFAPAYEFKAETSGIYNVGLTAFRSDALGWQALRWWQGACLEICRLGPGYCGDQKYLDDWPARFEGVHVLQHVGAGLAPWNMSKYQYGLSHGTLTIDGQPLIFFHFHAFQLVLRQLMGQHGYDIPELVRRHVYAPYVRALQRAVAEVRKVRPGYHAAFEWPRRSELANDIRSGRFLWVW